ncbi:MAG: DUF5667 domain-containing protein [Candidatus Nomurabacteria bacterium]|nr:DUF5667 domain-containing protein [Candidatus Nomurabacteria bacterium]
MIPFIIALIIGLTGSTASIAEKAIPGDFLYGVKVHINEPVAGIFSLTKEEKTEWKERLVERRLDEAQKLISNNNFDEKVRVELENKINNQIEDFNKSVSELALQKNKSTNSSNLNIRFQASLDAYNNIFGKLNNKATTTEETKTETTKLVNNIIIENVKVLPPEETKKVNILSNVIKRDVEDDMGEKHYEDNDEKDNEEFDD